MRVGNKGGGVEKRLVPKKKKHPDKFMLQQLLYREEYQRIRIYCVLTSFRVQR